MRALATSVCTFAIFVATARLARADADVARPPAVLDQGDFFSPGGIAAAEKLAVRVHDELGQDILVLTYPRVPDNKVNEFQQKGKDRFFADWLNELAARHKVRGILILIVGNPRHLQIGVQKSLLASQFTTRDRDTLRDLMVDRFHHNAFDRGLLDGMRFILDRIRQNKQAH